MRVLMMRLIILCATLGFTVTTIAQTDDRPLTEKPYLGMSIRHDVNANKCIIGWIYPGPLNGTGIAADHHIQRGDYLLYIDEMEVHTLDDFQAAMKKYKPGDTVDLRIHHTEGNVQASVPTAGKGDIVEIVTVKLDSQSQWSGPVAWHRPQSERMIPEQVIPIEDEHTKLESFVIKNLQEKDIEAPIMKLIDYFHETLDKNYGFNMLDRVAYGFQYPMRLPELQQTITNTLPDITADPRLILREAANNIDASVRPYSDPVDLKDPAQALQSLATMIGNAQAKLDQSFEKIPPEDRITIKQTYPELVQFVADNFYINTHPEVKRLINALGSSMKVDFNALLDAGAAVAGVMAPSSPAKVEGSTIPVPQDLIGAVKGDLFGALHSDNGWIVYGGTGANEYDLSKIAVVVDAGGDDTYQYSSNERPSVQVVIDQSGNDTYTAGENIAGPGSALFGISILVDDSGNDTYEGATRSCGVGVMGIGIILDRNGADHYTGKQWSCGAAFYGCGAIIDLGGNSDVYTTETFSQAIGGPRGFGLILDQNGRDLYRNNGPVPSGYGTAAVYSGISQGVGFGVRGYDTGGIGVLCDLAGDDRYEAGEFSQGGGYYWGLGILYDKSGRDMYYGNRYTQGFAAHQALGILADDAGDDTYWGMTAATQSGSWDICSTLLIDRAGNDSYQADGLAQGGASMQAIAWLIDLGGHDRYNAPNGATQGQSGGNSYHYDATKCFSFSLLLDAGGTSDFYSGPNRADGVTLSTGSMNEKTPKNSSLHGLFIDTAEPTIFWP